MCTAPPFVNALASTSSYLSSQKSSILSKKQLVLVAILLRLLPLFLKRQVTYLVYKGNHRLWFIFSTTDICKSHV